MKSVSLAGGDTLSSNRGKKNTKKNPAATPPGVMLNGARWAQMELSQRRGMLEGCAVKQRMVAVLWPMPGAVLPPPSSELLGTE